MYREIDYGIHLHHELGFFVCWFFQDHTQPIASDTIAYVELLVEDDRKLPIPLQPCPSGQPIPAVPLEFRSPPAIDSGFWLDRPTYHRMDPLCSAVEGLSDPPVAMLINAMLHNAPFPSRQSSPVCFPLFEFHTCTSELSFEPVIIRSRLEVSFYPMKFQHHHYLRG
jgi:hypothetical protein